MMHLDALQTILTLIAIWVFMFWFYADYCVDAFRQKMFAIRDELFDYAAQGNIQFDDEAYHYLRSNMNALIRMGHRLSVLQMVLVVVVVARNSNNLSTDDNWENCIAAHDDVVIEKLNSFKDRMHTEMITQAVMGSPIISISIIVPILFLAFQKAFSKRVIHWLERPLNRLDTANLLMDGM